MCKNCAFVTTGYECPQCHDVVERYASEGFFLLSGRVWGNDAVPVYNEGLDSFTTGRSDADRKAREKGLRHREPGESLRKESRAEWHKRNRKRIRPPRESISVA